MLPRRYIVEIVVAPADIVRRGAPPGICPHIPAFMVWPGSV
jgi:hypothetical protein